MFAKIYECEECYVDLRSEDDPDGTGNLTSEGWLCDDCLNNLVDEGDNSPG